MCPTRARGRKGAWSPHCAHVLWHGAAVLHLSAELCRLLHPALRVHHWPRLQLHGFSQSAHHPGHQLHVGIKLRCRVLLLLLLPVMPLLICQSALAASTPPCLAAPLAWLSLTAAAAAAAVTAAFITAAAIAACISRHRCPAPLVQSAEAQRRRAGQGAHSKEGKEGKGSSPQQGGQGV